MRCIRVLWPLTPGALMEHQKYLINGGVQAVKHKDDCNHRKVVDQFFYMCNAYSSSYSSIKRETNSGNNGFADYGNLQALSDDDGQSLQEVQIPPHQYEWNPHNPNRGVPPQQQQQQQQPMRPSQLVVPTSPNSYNMSDASYKNANVPKESPSSNVPKPLSIQTYPEPPPHRERLHPVSDPIEPEDFDSFNDYYLNPVYADADWQSSIERWRRNPHIKDEIWRFVRNKCCVAGCPFPDDYWELDKRVNICGMR